MSIGSLLFDIFKNFILYRTVQIHYSLGETIPSTIAVSSALSSGNEGTRPPASPTPKRRRTQKIRAATSTRVHIVEYSVSEKGPDFEIFAESKELDYE